MEGRFRDKQLVYRSPTGLTNVMKAWDLQKNCVVAVKEIMSESSDKAETQLLEAQAQMSLFHPFLCRLWDAYTTSTHTVLILEWMDTDLDQYLRTQRRNQGQFTYPDTEKMAVGVIDALAYAQCLGLCHRDIKPGNLFLSSTGEVKLGDFGSAVMSDPSQSAYSITGTPMFLSPILRLSYARFLSGEKESRIVHDPYKSDVYSLGLTILYCYTEDISGVIRLKTDQEIAQEIEKIPGNDWMKEILIVMLRVEEEQRPDFIQLRRWLFSTHPDRFLPIINSIFRLSGSVWDQLIEYHIYESMTETVCLKAESVLETRCKACGGGIRLVGETQKTREKEAEYCSAACLKHASGGSFASFSPAKRRFRLQKPHQKQLISPCISCSTDKMGEEEPILLCEKHCLCSVECMQELSNALSWSEGCPVCKPESNCSTVQLRKEIVSLQRESEETYSVRTFERELEPPKEISERVRENYETILKFLRTNSPFEMMNTVLATPELPQLFLPIVMKMHITIKTCTDQKHGMDDRLILSLASINTNRFRTPITDMMCVSCGRAIRRRDIAVLFNRSLALIRPHSCQKCHRVDNCHATECCGLVLCASCSSRDECDK